jgi:23S rRNA pseudouridine2604 synthase
MSELDMCSRREADRLILNGRVKTNGQTMNVGDKVPSDISANEIEIINDKKTEAVRRSKIRQKQQQQYPNMVLDSVVLNKPTGHVSGQAEHGHPPAIRLLTRENFWQQQRNHSDIREEDGPIKPIPPPFLSWERLATAGRLDLDSTGLLIFTRDGVLAKKLIQHNSKIEKEYVVDVVPAIQPTRRELLLNPTFQLPRPTLDLSKLLRGGETLLEDNNNSSSNNNNNGHHRRYRSKPLEPCHVEWINYDKNNDSARPGKHSLTPHPADESRKLRFVLTEGRKNHIRRACREILGWHVTNLQRVRIGPIYLDDRYNDHNSRRRNDDHDKLTYSYLPEGRWRPLRQDEIDTIMSS